MRLEKSMIILVILEIFLLVNMAPAQSWQISQIDNSQEPQISGEKSIINKGLSLLVGFLSIKQIGIVSASVSDIYSDNLYSGEYKAMSNQFFASDEGQICCTLMNNGATCQMVPVNYDGCSEGSLIPTSCENVDVCSDIGCCIDEEEGLCATNTIKQECLLDGGKFDSQSDCNFEECNPGCCILGGDVEWITQDRCMKRTVEQGFENTIFNRSLEQWECLEQKTIQTRGACMLGLGICVFETEVECAQDGGEFYGGYLCSHKDLNSGCKRQEGVGCVDGFDEVYWIDSCGNMENIYSLDNDTSWNGGVVLNKSQSCGIGGNNIESEDCGNCKYELGSMCQKTTAGEGVEDGNAICANMNCIDTPKGTSEKGNNRINGESWCVFDGAVGDGKDIIGSRYWRRMCIDGEIKVEGCSDYRNEVCAEEKIPIGMTQNTELGASEDNVTRSYATCRTNRWKNCFAMNSGEGGGTDNDCYSQSIKIGDASQGFYLPHYTPGLKFWGGEEEEQAKTQAQCGMASQECVVVYVREDRYSDFECVKNCECETSEFTQNLHEFCTGLGDCGSYINIEGVMGSGGYSVSGAPDMGFNFNDLLNVIPGKMIAPGSGEDYGYSGGWDRESFQGGRGSDETIFQGIIYQGVKAAIIIALALLGGGLITLLLWFIIDFIASFFEGGVKKVIVKFNCYPWKAPVNDQRCEACNDDALKPCTEYRCKSLGAACELLNAGEENPSCYEDNPDDVQPPVISVGNISNGFKFIGGENGAEIKTIDDKCIPEFTPIMFSIKTNEFTECKRSFIRTFSYDDSSEYFGDNPIFAKEHISTYMMPSLSALEVYDVNGTLAEKLGTLSMYVRCMDTHGNYNINEFELKFCIKNGPDITAPLVTGFIPPTNSYVGYGLDLKNATLWLMEPAVCKWTSDANKSYDEMENTMICGENLTDYGTFGWDCNTTFTGIEKGENKFYVKCKDQPWLAGVNDSARNTHAENIEYILIGSERMLEVRHVAPSRVIEAGFDPVTVDLTAKTYGGAEEGKAICEFDFPEQNWSGEFFKTNDDEHKQPEWVLMAGAYFMNVTCVDAGGNVASNGSEFEIKLDQTAPEVTRVYNDDGLRIETNELAECSYTTHTCNFDFENGTLMTTGYSSDHGADWNVETRYYIKCRDIFMNIKEGCSIRVLPSLFG